MRSVMIALALFAAACSQPGTTASSAPATEPPATTTPAMPQNQAEATAQDTCGASRYRNLIGTAASAIDRSTLPPNTRFISPGMMITQDFSPQRLNITTGVDGKVSSLACF